METIQTISRKLASRASVTRAAAAERLARFGDKRAMQLLHRCLKDPSLEVRMRAAESLAAYPGASVRLLTRALNDDDELVRASAAESLGEIGNRKALKRLRLAMKDESPLVRS